MNKLAAATACLLLLMLAACSSQPSRHSGTGSGGSSRSYRGSSGGGSGVQDDLSLSQSRRYRSNQDSVPDGPPPDFSKLPEPIPKIEPLSLYGNKSPYSVLGHSYNVLSSAHGYVERGTASYYGSKFHRYKTSTLEDYDMYGYSAAHKTLPLPSYVRVTNLDNGKSVVVRVNDRGPFKDDRLIDLSYIAAVKIGVWPSGTARVEVRALDPGTEVLASAAPPAPPPVAAVIPAAAVASKPFVAPTPAPTLAPTPSPGVPPAAITASTNPPVSRTVPPPVPTAPAQLQPMPGIYLQVGVFADRSNAERVAERIRGAQIGNVQIDQLSRGGRLVQRVRVGPMADSNAASTASQRIVQIGLPKPQLAVN